MPYTFTRDVRLKRRKAPFDPTVHTCGYVHVAGGGAHEAGGLELAVVVLLGRARHAEAVHVGQRAVVAVLQLGVLAVVGVVVARQRAHGGQRAAQAAHGHHAPAAPVHAAHGHVAGRHVRRSPVQEAACNNTREATSDLGVADTDCGTLGVRYSA